MEVSGSDYKLVESGFQNLYRKGDKTFQFYLLFTYILGIIIGVPKKRMSKGKITK